MANSPISRPLTSFTVPWSLLRLLTIMAPDNWTDLTYQARTVGSAFEHSLVAVDRSGVTYRIRGIDEGFPEVVQELRLTEYSHENGPWFGISVNLKSDGTKVMTRRYGVAPAFEQPVPDAAYAEDLQLFPRADAAIPGWLREKAGLPPARPAAADATADGDSAAPAAQPPQPAAAPDELRYAKVYDGTDQQTGAPIVHRTGLTVQEAAQILAYLKAGPIFLFGRSFDNDAFDPQSPPAVPRTFATDGTWIWSGGVAYYLEKYRMPPENDLLAHIRAQNYVLPEVTQKAKDTARDQLTGGRGPAGDPGGSNY